MSVSDKRMREREAPGEPRRPGRADEGSRGGRSAAEKPEPGSWTSRAPKVFRAMGRLDFRRLARRPARHAYSEFAGRGGLDATRYGDWEYSGRCTDF